jgi:hypothetical protein
VFAFPVTALFFLHFRFSCLSLFLAFDFPVICHLPYYASCRATMGSTVGSGFLFLRVFRLMLFG